jgi:hypothetical protein
MRLALDRWVVASATLSHRDVLAARALNGVVGFAFPQGRAAGSAIEMCRYRALSVVEGRLDCDSKLYFLKTKS